MVMSSPIVAEDSPARRPHFVRALGLKSAIAVNMTQMCGIGPFVTIPLMVTAMGGPQAMFAWLLGAILAMADGLVWAELGAAMPGAGGTYLYLREAFQYRTGRLMPFLFNWTIILGIPLMMSTGVIGIVQYLGYYFPSLAEAPAAPGTPLGGLATLQHVKITIICIAIVGLVIFTLYRSIAAVGAFNNILFVVMLLTVGSTIVACGSHFHASLAFAFPAGAFHWRGAFWLGLGQGLIYAIYDYGGYQTTAYMGDELREPGRTIPLSIIWSIFGMMAIYLVMNVAVMGVVPWQEVADSKSVGSLVIERTWGRHAALVFTALVIITGFASIVTGLLGASRIPYNAARDKLFFPVFARLHPKMNFPHVGLLVMGAMTAFACFFPLDQLINMLTAALVLIQGIAQVAALFVLRDRQPGLRRPYRMTLYPVPAILAVVGWSFVYYYSGWIMIGLSVGWLILGAIAFLIWASFERTWPFGPIEVREAFVEGQETKAHADTGTRGC